jgi:hypothetical protein
VLYSLGLARESKVPVTITIIVGNYFLLLPILPCVDVPVVELLVQIQEESIVSDIGQNVFRLWP